MIIAGHRGARGEAPENTVAGFRQTYARGIRHFELDLQLSLDGEVMVFHDTGLKRTTGVSGKMTDWSAAALGQLKAHYPWVHGWQDCEIPRLSDVLSVLPEVEWIQFEIKGDSQLRMDRLSHQLLWLIDAFDFADKSVVTSFNRWVLRHIKTLRPTLRTGFVTDDRLINPVKVAQSLRADLVIPHYPLVTAPLVKEAHACDLHVSTWTVNSVEEARRLKHIGTDSVITDYPTLIGRSLGA